MLNVNFIGLITGRAELDNRHEEHYAQNVVKKYIKLTF
jgi:hypothetical protein